MLLLVVLDILLFDWRDRVWDCVATSFDELVDDILHTVQLYARSLEDVVAEDVVDNVLATQKALSHSIDILEPVSCSEFGDLWLVVCT